MVVALGPGRFYGNSLPRPRIYDDVKFNDFRIDPPVPVTDPLLFWAEEAHWSMGGLSFKRHRLQGRIEGNINKIRAEQEKLVKKTQKQSPRERAAFVNTPLPPPAPVALKRKRRLIEEVENEEREESWRGFKSFPARNLDDDFDKVAHGSGSVDVDAEEMVTPPIRGRRSQKAAVETEAVAKPKPSGLKRLKKGIKSIQKDGPVTPTGKRSSLRSSKPELA